MVKLLTENIYTTTPDLVSYKSSGGYEPLKKALSKGAAWINEQLVLSELRGRGGAAFPTGKKWSLLAKKPELPTYFITNCDESEPGTFKDRLLIERAPHLILEGTIIGSFAIGAHKAFIYIRGEYGYGTHMLYRALEEAYHDGILGKSVMGSNYNLDIVIHRGAGAYICGEETALIESIEGKRGQPRVKPPFFPAVIGLYGAPTVVNNAETIANLPTIVKIEGAAFASIGVPNSRGTKLVSASGNINRPGVYEIEMGYGLLDFIYNECGGITEGRKIKAVIPGGSSVNVLRGDELENVKLDYDSLRNAGSSLGCAGFVVIDETVSMTKVVANLAHFYAHESCGKCTPCREGSHWISKIFDRLLEGDGSLSDTGLILDLCSQIKGQTVCAFGDTMVLPYESIIKKFPHEFEQLININSQQRTA